MSSRSLNEVMQIRDFCLADYDNVLALWHATGIAPSAGDDKAGIAARLQRDLGLFLLAHDEGQLLGVVMGTYDGRRGWVNHLAVAPAWQGRSIGAALLNALEARLREMGCAKINLLIEPENAAVTGFYEAAGYARDELIFMEKWLN